MKKDVCRVTSSDNQRQLTVKPIRIELQPSRRTIPCTIVLLTVAVKKGRGREQWLGGPKTKKTGNGIAQSGENWHNRVSRFRGDGEISYVFSAGRISNQTISSTNMSGTTAGRPRTSTNTPTSGHQLYKITFGELSILPIANQAGQMQRFGKSWRL
jgi:hypothetical protein